MELRDRDPNVVGAEVMESVVKRGKIAPLGIFIKTQTYPWPKKLRSLFQATHGRLEEKCIVNQRYFSIYSINDALIFRISELFLHRIYIFQSRQYVSPRNTDRHVNIKQPCVLRSPDYTALYCVVYLHRYLCIHIPRTSRY